ncbi:MAG: BrnT family toxin, partial [Luteibacter sp.]
MLYDFDWDSAKAAVNLRKHDIALGDARFFILDEHRIDRLDERYVYGEDRSVSIAAVDGRLMLVIYTISE